MKNVEKTAEEKWRFRAHMAIALMIGSGMVMTAFSLVIAVGNGPV